MGVQDNFAGHGQRAEARGSEARPAVARGEESGASVERVSGQHRTVAHGRQAD
jgi:hypothetical protein